MDLNNLLVGYCAALVDLHHKADPGIIVANNTAVSQYVPVKNVWSLLTRIQCTQVRVGCCRGGGEGLFTRNGGPVERRGAE
jgi:hypothetical protein